MRLDEILAVLAKPCVVQLDDGTWEACALPDHEGAGPTPVEAAAACWLEVMRAARAEAGKGE